MLKKLIFPLIYVSEWILFLYVLLFVFIFNMVYFANMIFIDMPWEEPIVLSSSILKSLLFIAVAGIICFLYMKYLTGNRVYKRFKEVIWGTLFGLNTLSCILWLIASYGFNLSTNDRLLLLAAIIVSVILTVQTIKRFRNEA